MTCVSDMAVEVLHISCAVGPASVNVPLARPGRRSVEQFGLT